MVISAFPRRDNQPPNAGRYQVDSGHPPPCGPTAAGAGGGPGRRSRRGLADTLMKWLFFEVCIAFFAPLLGLMDSLLRGNSFDFFDSVKIADIYLISIAFVAGTLGDLIKNMSDRFLHTERICASGLAVFTLLLSAWGYTRASMFALGDESAENRGLAYFAVTVLIMSTLISVASLLLAEVNR